MNKQRMEETAKYIESLPDEKFYMGDWIHEASDVTCELDALQHDCETACCIAGWVTLHAGECLTPSAMLVGKPEETAVSFARNYLDLTFDEADKLFKSIEWPTEYYRNWAETPVLAAARIRHMIETGE